MTQKKQPYKPRTFRIYNIPFWFIGLFLLASVVSCHADVLQTLHTQQTMPYDRHTVVPLKEAPLFIHTASIVNNQNDSQLTFSSIVNVDPARPHFFTSDFYFDKSLNSSCIYGNSASDTDFNTETVKTITKDAIWAEFAHTPAFAGQAHGEPIIPDAPFIYTEIAAKSVADKNVAPGTVTIENTETHLTTDNSNPLLAQTPHRPSNTIIALKSPKWHDPFSQQVKPRKTPWGEPWNHNQLVTNLNKVLKSYGITSENVRIRMIAHAIIASGWRQNIWHHNAWGVQKGSWDQKWYEMPTEEVDENGHRYYVPDATWRAFHNWEHAISDYLSRITIHSNRPAYRRAARHLNAPGWKSDGAFWRELGNGRYYTDKAFTPKMFSMLCWTVRKIMAENTAGNPSHL